MFHNTLFRLERSQKKWLLWLGISFLCLSVIWFFVELLEWKFPLEPVVVFVGGIVTLLAIYWPWKPGYADKRLKSRITCDYMSNDHKFIIGHSEYQFTLQFSKRSDKSIYLYNDPPDIEEIALIHGAGQIKEVRDVTALVYTNRAVIPEEGQLVALKNHEGNYAVIHIHDIRDSTRNDDRDEVTFSYAINPDGGTDFS
ncbi:hypothetical protein [Kiloniella antarctica]|uniref:SMODS-associating 2TM beta-strand rich effector domain-containing protein n=1 Tax=Kiloniella antarctica TaxID=1550907 RepID=A0ABW5BJG3_9PROT